VSDCHTKVGFRCSKKVEKHWPKLTPQKLRVTRPWPRTLFRKIKHYVWTVAGNMHAKFKVGLRGFNSSEDIGI